MGHSVEGLVKVAVDVEARGDCDQVLNVDLALGPVGWEIELLDDVSAGVEGNEEVLHSTVAL